MWGSKLYESEKDNKYDPISRGAMHTWCEYHNYEYVDILEGNGWWGYDIVILNKDPLITPIYLEGLIKTAWKTCSNYTDNDYIFTKGYFNIIEHLHIYVRKDKCFHGNYKTMFFIFNKIGTMFRTLILTRDQLIKFEVVKIKRKDHEGNLRLEPVYFIPIEHFSRIFKIEEFIINDSIITV